MASKRGAWYAGGMDDFLRNMDPAHRAFMVIFIAVFIKGLILVWWDRYQTRQARRPTPMKLRDGVYVPWGPVDRIKSAGNMAVKIWLVYMALMLAVLIYAKLMGIRNLF